MSPTALSNHADRTITSRLSVEVIEYCLHWKCLESST